MKRFMLLLAATVSLLSSCTKEANEPINALGDNGEEGSFEFSMEGIREDLFTQEGKALQFNPKVHTTGGKISKISPSTQKGKITGVAYFYGPSIPSGIPVMLEFDVDGKHISYNGAISHPRLKSSVGEIRRAGYTKVSFFVGGNIKPQTEEDKQKGIFEYNVGINGGQNTMIQRTTEGLDLSSFNPIFVSEGNDVEASKNTGGAMTTERGKFRLFGEVVNIRFRNNQHGANLRFNGLDITGFASRDLNLRMIWDETQIAPRLVCKTPASKSPGRIFFPLPDKPGEQHHELNGPASATAPATAINGDPSYTLYLLTEAEPAGSIRFAYTNTVKSVFTKGTPASAHHTTNLMGKTSNPKNYGKYHNITLELVK